jgi:hypothetical protein
LKTAFISELLRPSSYQQYCSDESELSLSAPSYLLIECSEPHFLRAPLLYLLSNVLHPSWLNQANPAELAISPWKLSI